MISITKTLASSQAGLRRDLKAAFTRLSERVNAVIIRNAGVDGLISRRAEKPVRREAGEIVQRFFVGLDGRSAYASDGVTPMAEYPRILNKWYAITVAAVVDTHHKWMLRHIPDDVFAWLANKPSRSIPIRETDNPYLRQPGETVDEHIRRLEALRLFSPSPFAEYDPMHTWVDPNGYQLDDRIWNASTETRRQIDATIARSIREGQSAVNLATLLERFLIPGRAALRTNLPYGTDASYYAMRLARTEISRAANHAAYIASVNNPYAVGIDWALSPSHPKTDICDQLATIGMSGVRIKDAYPLNAPQIPPAHPHCLCRSQTYIAQSQADITAQLRAIMQDAEEQNLRPYLTPAQIDEYKRSLLGDYLMSVIPQAA